MPWLTPTLKEVRSLVRDNIRGSLPGADASVPNSVLRVLSDAQGGLCHLNLQYLDWLALQLLPDTAETEWLDRHGDIWLVNADGTTGRKMATFSSGTVNLTGVDGTVVPIGTQLEGSSLTAATIGFETTAEITLGDAATPVAVRALDPGAIGNLEAGTSLSVISAAPGVDNTATVVALSGGTDIETDDDLRYRILARIRQPPMGGAQHDYEQWALSVPGVTRAWAAPEQGIGTITVRFMMDVLRADNDGFPLPEDEQAVALYMDTMRPVTVKDCYVLAPIKQPIDVVIDNLVPPPPGNEAVIAAIEQSVKDMLRQMAAPGQTIYAAWKSHAIMETPGVVSFRLVNTDDDVMPSLGHMAVLDTILYE